MRISDWSSDVCSSDLLYLLRQALEVDALGKQFIRDPDQIVGKIGFDALKSIAKKILSDLIVDMNAELEEREQTKNAFDHKRELKSPTAVRALQKQNIPSHEQAIRPNPAKDFRPEVEAQVKPTTT